MFDLNSEDFKRRLAVKDYIFDEKNQNFYPNDEYNTFFILHTQQYFNDLLRVQGFVFLNDVLKALGIKPRTVGQISGWNIEGVQSKGFIEIKITQKKIRDGKTVEYFLEIEHEGVILDALGD